MAGTERLAAGTTGGLLERAEELHRIGRVLDAAAAGEASLTLIGAPAGMGKTKLLEAGVEAAAPVGVTPLLARASELERDFAFGLVRQLVEPVVVAAAAAERAELFAGPARRAATVLDLESEPDLDRDPLTTIHGLYWLLVNLSATSPLLVAIDDLQWVDEPSLRWLAYLVRRLDRLPIAVLATVREDEAGAADLPAEISEAGRRAMQETLAHEPAVRLRPRPLSSAAVPELLERAVGESGDPDFAAACHARTTGNPFLLSELIAELAADGLAPRAASVPELERIVPRRFGETIRRHLARLSPDARELAAAVAVIGDGEDLHLGGELAGLGADAAAAAAAELVRTQVFEDVPVLRFRHPLLRAAVAAEPAAPERARRHARAARLLADRGRAAPRVASHLLLSPAGSGDGWAVEQLRAAARSARSQGAAERAIALLERALAEPPAPEQRGEVLTELAWAELSALRDTAAERFAAARDLESDPERRAELALGRGHALYHHHRHAEAVETLLAGIEEVEDVPELREQWLRLEATLAIIGRYDLETEAQIRGRLAGIARGLEGETAAEQLVLATTAGEKPATAADLARATELQVRARSALPGVGLGTDAAAVAMYLHAGRPDAAAALSERLIAAALEEGSPLRHAMATNWRGMVEFDLGELAEAASDLEAAIASFAELGAAPIGGVAASYLAVTLAWRGSLAAADELLREHDLDGELPARMVFNPSLFLRGVLRLEQRRFEAAEEDFRELGRRHQRWGFTRPSPPWRSACALACLGRGNREEARRLAAEELALARTWDTPKSISFATRALGLASDGEASIELLGEAVELLERTPWRLDRARARCDLGAALRRDGQRRRGREALALAMDEAHACGAGPLAERAAEELKASGARPRRRAISGLDALTPAELRVARLAASGRSNREIAQQLFVTIATVETHLTRVYRKLDLEGREGLAAAIGEPAAG